MPGFQTVLRYVVFAAFALSILVALASWLVRTRRVSPFGPLSRALRTVTDPLLRPVETRLVRAGGNPARAGWWLVVGVAVVGVVLVSLGSWLVDTAYHVRAELSRGPRGMLTLLIDGAYAIVVVALAVRVLAGWFGYFRYTKWLRPAYALTDWLVEPIRRLLPPTGALDWSPLVAWLVLLVLHQLLPTIVGS